MENYKTLMKFEYTRYTRILLIFIIAFSFIASSKMIDNVFFLQQVFLLVVEKFSLDPQPLVKLSNSI